MVRAFFTSFGLERMVLDMVVPLSVLPTSKTTGKVEGE